MAMKNYLSIFLVFLMVICAKAMPGQELYPATGIVASNVMNQTGLLQVLTNISGTLYTNGIATNLTVSSQFNVVSTNGTSVVITSDTNANLNLSQGLVVNSAGGTFPLVLAWGTNSAISDNVNQYGGWFTNINPNVTVTAIGAYNWGGAGSGLPNLPLIFARKSDNVTLASGTVTFNAGNLNQFVYVSVPPFKLQVGVAYILRFIAPTTANFLNTGTVTIDTSITPLFGEFFTSGGITNYGVTSSDAPGPVNFLWFTNNSGIGQSTLTASQDIYSNNVLNVSSAEVVNGYLNDQSHTTSNSVTLGNIDGQSYTLNGQPLNFTTATAGSYFTTNCIALATNFNGVTMFDTVHSWWTNSKSGWVMVPQGNTNAAVSNLVVSGGIMLSNPLLSVALNNGQPYFTKSGPSLIGQWGAQPSPGGGLPFGQAFVSILTSSNNPYVGQFTGTFTGSGSGVSNVTVVATNVIGLPSITNFTEIVGAVPSAGTFAQFTGTTNTDGSVQITNATVSGGTGSASNALVMVTGTKPITNGIPMFTGATNSIGGPIITNASGNLVFAGTITVSSINAQTIFGDAHNLTNLPGSSLVGTIQSTNPVATFLQTIGSSNSPSGTVFSNNVLVVGTNAAIYVTATNLVDRTNLSNVILTMVPPTAFSSQITTPLIQGPSGSMTVSAGSGTISSGANTLTPGGFFTSAGFLSLVGLGGNGSGITNIPASAIATASNNMALASGTALITNGLIVATGTTNALGQPTFTNGTGGT